MKLLFLLGCLLLVQSSFCDDGDVTSKKCEDFLGADTCQNLRDLAAKLNEKATIVSDAVKSAIQHHKTKAQEMLAYIKEYMTERITCANIFSDTACKNMETAIQKFHEQRKLLQEAIFSAAEKHFNNAKEFLANVQKTIVDKAVNFKCTDVLTAQQCDQLTKLSTTFKLKAGELKTLLEEVIVNGTITAKQIYSRTIGAMLNHLDNVKCEDMISATACAKLDTLASNLKETTEIVKIAVATAISNGISKTQDIIQNASTFLKERFSCEKVLGENICQKLEKLTSMLHVNFQKVIDKIRDLYATGVQKATDIYAKVSTYIWNLFWGSTSKRSLTGQTIKDYLLKLIEKATTLAKDAKEKLKAELERLYNAGKLKWGQLQQTVKELIAKYGPQSDESFDAEVKKSLIEQIKEALKTAHGKAKILLQSLLTKSKEQLEKLKEVIKTLLGNQDQSDAVDLTHDIVSDLAEKELDEELEKAMNQVDKLME